MRQERRAGIPEAAAGSEQPQRIVLPICRQCGAEFKRLSITSSRGGVRRYRCGVCGNTFKVAVVSRA